MRLQLWACQHHLVPHEKSLPKIEVTREENSVNRQREMNSFDNSQAPNSVAPEAQFPGLFQLSELYISYFELGINPLKSRGS